MRRCLLALLLVMALSLSGLVVAGHSVAMRAPRGPALQPSTPRAVSTLSRSDVNGDCAIDLLDLALVSASYHAPYPFPHAQADINGDGAIDLLDLVLVAMNYGWRCPGNNILVAPSCSQFDVPRNDDPYLAEECVCLQNADGAVADLSGWHVRDEQGNRYEFPPFSLPGGAYVRLHTGIGINTGTDLYWGRDSEVWDNSGDTVFVYDDEWQLVERYHYGISAPTSVWTPTPTPRVSITPLPTSSPTPRPTSTPLPTRTPTPSQSTCISAADTWNHLYQYACVEYDVVFTHFDPSSNTAFLDSHLPYKDHFATVIYGDWRGCWPAAPEVYFSGKRIRVVGPLRWYPNYNQPQIVVANCSDVQIVQ